MFRGWLIKPVQVQLSSSKLRVVGVVRAQLLSSRVFVLRNTIHISGAVQEPSVWDIPGLRTADSCSGSMHITSAGFDGISIAHRPRDMDLWHDGFNLLGLHHPYGYHP